MKTLRDTPAATGSQASEAGSLPCDTPVGLQMSLFGPDHAHVNPFRVPVDSEVRKTNGTFGRNGIVSSASVALQQSLVSKLVENLDVNGSTEYHLTWKSWGMPSQRRICQLRASARLSSHSDCFGWPRPTATDGEGGGSSKRCQAERAGQHHVVRVRDILAGMRASGLLTHSGTNVAFHSAMNAWLMGYSVEFIRYADSAIPSSRKSRQSS